MLLRARVLVVALILLSLCAAAQVQAGVNKEIRFAAGASSGTVSGAVIRGESDTWRLSARKGQKMMVTIKSVESNAVFQIYAPHSEAGLSGAADGDDAMHWTGTLPASGEYRIVVGGTRGNATYKLTVSIH